MKQIKQILWGGLLLTIATTTARAQYNYITNNGTITITGYTGPSGLVNIPGAINGLPVTSIGDDAFGLAGPIFISSVIIPNSVTNIGNDAFFAQSSLMSVTLGSGVISIGTSAFDGCRITLGITLPNGLVSIGAAAFGFSSLSSVSIPATVTNISGNPFPGCSSLAAIGVNTNNPAYTNVAGVLVSKDLTLLVGYPAGKTNGSYVISNSIVAIADQAFNNCTKLTNITIPNGVMSIGSNAFANCLFTNIMIPASVTTIGTGPFAPCGFLTAITVDPGNPVYHDVAGVLFDANMFLVQYPDGYPTNFYSIPAGTTGIGAEAFQLCSRLTGLTIPNTVTSIGDGAFYDCANLTNVTIPDSVTNMGNQTFLLCSALTNATISSNIATVSPEAFLFSGLVNVTIPLGVKDIGAAAFEDTPLGTVTIPASVTNIETDAFVSCSALSNVVISGSVSNIGFDAFEDCANLAGVYFEGSAPAADSTAFRFDSKAMVFFLPGTSGWDSSLGGAPTAIWQPAMRNSGMADGQFGFSISWASNYSVTVSANNDLTTTNWSPLTNIVVTNGLVSFSDATSANNGQRYYRLSWP